jgi:ribosomal protein S18 acetylase RimI-like enzyme
MPRPKNALSINDGGNPYNPLSPSDVWEWQKQNASDAWKAAQDPQTWRDAANQYGQALLMGSVAPGAKIAPAEAMWDAFDAAHAASGLDKFSHMKLFQHGPRDLEISHIGVDPAKRGQGIGNKLMEMLTQHADEHGVNLHASPASDADGSVGLDAEGLHDWYQRWGFDEAGGGDRLTRRPYTGDE